MKCFLVGYRGSCHLSLVFSSYTHSPKCSCVYTENTSYAYPTRKHCITSIYYTILYYTILYYTILHYTILYYTILHYTILYYTILYYTILYYTILYYTILYYTILHYTILYYTILHCTIHSTQTFFSEQKLFKQHGTIKTHLDAQGQQHKLQN